MQWKFDVGRLLASARAFACGRPTKTLGVGGFTRKFLSNCIVTANPNRAAFFVRAMAGDQQRFEPRVFSPLTFPNSLSGTLAATELVLRVQLFPIVTLAFNHESVAR